MENKKDTFSSRWQQLTEESTLHGLRGTSREGSHVFQKVIWISLIVIMSGFYFAIAGLSIHNYYKYETLSSVKQVWIKEQELPAITICPLSLFSKSRMESVYPGLLNPDAPEVFNISKDECLLRQTSNQDDQTEAPRLLGDEIFNELHLESAIPIEDFFIKCKWRNIKSLNCSDVFEATIIQQGVCYTLNPKAENADKFLVRQAGVDFGLTLTIDIHQEEFVFNENLDGAGLTLMVHERNTMAHSKQNMITLAPGFEHNIAIDRYTTKRLPPPYSDTECVDSSEYLIRDLKYSKDGCLSMCQINDRYKNCDCSVDGLSNERPCTLCDILICGNFEYETYFDGKCGCKPLCSETNYKGRVSSYLYPSDGAMDKVIQEIPNRNNLSDIRNNIMNVALYFEKMEYTLSVEKPAMSLSQVISDLGGSLGLFLGASVITLIEFVEFGIVSIMKIYNKRKQKVQQVYPETNEYGDHIKRKK